MRRKHIPRNPQNKVAMRIWGRRRKKLRKMFNRFVHTIYKPEE